MKMNKRVDAYLYLQVIILFAGLGSVISGLIVQLLLSAALLYQKYVKVILISLPKRKRMVIKS